MLLAVDIGNSQTVLGVFDEGGQPLFVRRIATNITQTADELGVLIRALFKSDLVTTDTLDCLIVASVVPPLTEHWIELGRALSIDDITVVSAQNCGELVINLDTPAEAGADRLANAVGAQMRYGTPAVVIDFGTATNIDVIDRSGAYCGGVISPGLETSAQALFSHAARLSAVDLVAPNAVIGTSTCSAVQSGLLFGEATKVEGLVQRIIAEMEDMPIVIATGGLAKTLAPLCSCIQHVDTTLTLFGLYHIAQGIPTRQHS